DVDILPYLHSSCAVQASSPDETPISQLEFVRASKVDTSPNHAVLPDFHADPAVKVEPQPPTMKPADVVCELGCEIRVLRVPDSERSAGRDDSRERCAIRRVSLTVSCTHWSCTS